MRRIVLITGATSGLGYELAAALANSHYDLILTCRNPDKGAVVYRQLTEANPEASIRMLALDLSSFASIDRFVANVREKYGRIDVLCNNAGLYMDKACQTAEGFEMTIGVNYIGPYYLTRKLIPLLKAGEQPQILQTCSIVAILSKWYKDRDRVFQKSTHGFLAYFASKQMQLMMTLHLAEELKDEGITVNAFHPGVVATDIWRGETPMMRFFAKNKSKRYALARDAAKTGLCLIENPAMRTVTGKFFEKLGQEIHLGPRFRDQAWIASLIRRTDQAILAVQTDSAIQIDNSTIA